jgi:PhnB protein
MVKSNTHLAFDGNCAEAFALYGKALDGETVFSTTYGATPAADTVPSNWKDKVIHATFEFSGQTLTGCDAPPGRYTKPQGFAVMLSVDDAKEAERLFAALSAGGKVEMPIQETFWAVRFAMFTDRFGTPWMINVGKTPA